MDLVEARMQGFGVSPRHPWERARCEVIRRLLARYVPLSRNAVVADVGCGDAFVIEQLAHAYPGRSFLGVDTGYASDTIGRYRARLQSSCIQLYQSLDDLDREIHGFAALVLLLDVLEHVEREGDFLRQIVGHPFVGRNTWFLITVPAYKWLFSEHDRRLGHYRRYSHASAMQLIQEAGLTSVRSGYFFSSLIPIRFCQVVVERVRAFNAAHAGSGSAHEWMGVSGWKGAALGRVLTRLLILDGQIGSALSTVGIRLPGLSVFAVCRKSA